MTFDSVVELLDLLSESLVMNSMMMIADFIVQLFFLLQLFIARHCDYEIKRIEIMGSLSFHFFSALTLIIALSSLCSERERVEKR